MTVTLVLNVLGVAVPLAALVWSAVVHSRDARSRKHAEQAERAGRLLELMKSIDLGGADAGLNREAVRLKHNKQIHDLERVVRVSAAEFSARALRPAASRALILVFLSYGVFLLGDGTALVVSAQHLPATRQLSTWLVAAVIGAVGMAGIVFAVVLGNRRGQTRIRQGEAGIAIPTLMEDVHHVGVRIHTFLLIRQLRRPDPQTRRRTTAEDSAP